MRVQHQCQKEADTKSHFILNGEINEVGIHQNPIRRSQGGVVLEEERRRNIWPEDNINQKGFMFHQSITEQRHTKR